MQKLPKRALIGNTGSLFMLGFFTIMWAGFIPGSIGATPFAIASFAIFTAFAIWLFIEATMTMRIVRKLPDSPATETDKRMGKHFGIIFGIEFFLIAVSFFLLGSGIIGNPNYIPSVITFIVGAHFIPLGIIFKMRIHIILGIIIMFVAAIGFVFIALGKCIDPANAVVSLVTALCVAIMGAYLLRFIKAQVKAINKR